MKTKQYCVVENNCDDIAVTIFSYSRKSQKEIEKLVTEIAKKYGVRDDLDFDWGCPENIIYIVNKFENWSVKAIVSK